jgi:hypothetical protein
MYNLQLQKAILDSITLSFISFSTPEDFIQL